MTSILLVGAGNVGGHILEFLARDADDFNVTVGDVDAAKAQQVVDNALVGGAKHGRYQRMRAVEVNLKDVGRTAELIARSEPDVIINCAVLQTWHRIRQLPKVEYERLSAATLGAWLPVQLLLPYRLAQAIRQSGSAAPFINTSLSDLTNPALATVGLAPTVGIGNVDVMAPAVQLLVARELAAEPEGEGGSPVSVAKVSAAQVNVTLVAHHVHWVVPREAGYREGAPFFLRVQVGGEDVTGRFDPARLLRDAVKLFPPGLDFTTVSASSAINNAKALVGQREVRTHAPGPNGLPGGYPVKIEAGKVTLDLAGALTEAEAVRFNEEAQTYDGVRAIDERGVEFMPYTQEIMADMLGFECAVLTFDELEERAQEQLRRYREFEERVMGR